VALGMQEVHHYDTGQYIFSAASFVGKHQTQRRIARDGAQVAVELCSVENVK